MTRSTGRHQFSRRTKLTAGMTGLALTVGLAIAITSTGDGGAAKADGADKSLFVDIKTVNANVKTPKAQKDASTGTFTVDCGENQNGHFNPDNFIAAPGKQNGAEHLHDYVGNLTTDANSTDDSLEGGGTTCKNGDESAYFWPVIRIDTGEEEAAAAADKADAGAADADVAKADKALADAKKKGDKAAIKKAEDAKAKAEAAAADNADAADADAADADVAKADKALADAKKKGDKAAIKKAEDAKAKAEAAADADAADADNADADAAAADVKAADKALADAKKKGDKAAIKKAEDAKAKADKAAADADNADAADANAADKKAADAKKKDQAKAKNAKQAKGQGKDEVLEGNDGEVQQAQNADLTFRGSPVGDVVAMPKFLKILYGDAKRSINGDKNTKASWTCAGFEDKVLLNKYPICPTDTVKRIHDFPSCWDGKNTDSANHRDHILFPDADGNCKKGFKAVPQLRVTLTYKIPVEIQKAAQYKVDSFPDEKHDPFTDHDDFANVMPDKLMDRLVDCVNSGKACKE